MTNDYEQYTFSPEYQDAILACLIAYPDKFIPYAHIFNSAYFTSLERICTARALFAYWRKYSRFPSWEVLEQVVLDTIMRTSEEKESEKVHDFIEKLKGLDTGDVVDVAAHCIGWARRRALYLAINEAANGFNTGEIPEDGYVSLIQSALKVGQNNDDLGYLIGPGDNDIAEIIANYTKSGFALSTGFPLLDDLLPAKGLQPGWLISILAPPKRYKTTFCINLAMNIASAGRPVFYYPCEITQTDAAIRTLCNLTDRSTQSIRQDPKGFTRIALEAARDTMGASVLIKGYPSKTVSVGGEIKSHALVSRHQLGLTPGAIVIDFAETVNSGADMKRTSEHRAQSQIYVEARALGAEMGCPVIMPDRCNRETVNKTVPQMDGFQGSFEKAGIVDLGIGLCSTEQEYLDNQLRYFIFLNRHGEANHHFRGNVHPKTQRLGEWTKIPWNPEDEEEDRPRGGRRRGRGGNRNQRRAVPEDIEA